MAGTRENHLAKAVAILRGGGLVAFATETVYGLGADATNSAAVRKVFEAKGRPGTNPLIVHVAGEEMARRYAARWPDSARRLAGKFWPGPLTIVVPKGAVIVPEVTAGRETVGLRVPGHALALELLKEFDGAVAAPSANRSGRVSPTTAGHVASELGDRVDLILDGGPCGVGIESTVVDVSADQPVILRPGEVTREQIEAVIGRVAVFSGSVAIDQGGVAPGMLAAHYQPKAPMYRIEIGEAGKWVEWRRRNPGERAVVLVIRGTALEFAFGDTTIVEMSDHPPEYARALYSALHNADAQGAGVIWAEMPPEEPRWAAVRDRLMRASSDVKV